MNLNPVELFWIVTNAAAAALTIPALADARRDAAAVKALNGHALGIIARGNVRREWVRLAMQLVLLAIAIPAAQRPGDIALTPALVLFLSLPVLVLLNTISEARDRARLAGKLR